jgi:pyridinium-3,5-biscarboxylic acid mononucleotide synthase
MNPHAINELLEKVRDRQMTVEEATTSLKDLPYLELGHTKLDTHRELRVGYPEVIYGAGKTPPQIGDIVSAMLPRGNNILITRAGMEQFSIVQQICVTAQYHDCARLITIRQRESQPPPTPIAVVTAGTSDLPVAEEAAVTAEFLGNRVERIFDVGVAGLHRLLDKLSIIRQSRVVIVIAGMEGALASVVGGLIDKPVIAVPTSIGYGASFGGLAAMLGMLTSCASNVTVVNIDNGFGAANVANLINKN